MICHSKLNTISHDSLKDQSNGCGCQGPWFYCQHSPQPFCVLGESTPLPGPRLPGSEWRAWDSVQSDHPKFHEMTSTLRGSLSQPQEARGLSAAKLLAVRIPVSALCVACLTSVGSSSGTSFF